MSADEQRAAIRTALSQRDIDRLAIAAVECVTAYHVERAA